MTLVDPVVPDGLMSAMVPRRRAEGLSQASQAFLDWLRMLRASRMLTCVLASSGLFFTAAS